MCGITGIFDLRREGRADGDAVRAMTDVLVHRGPDAEGFLVEPDLALGFRRLSIIDLHTGDQPLHNEDGSLSLVCNGEIYGYRELRGELARRGHALRTETDVEVLLHLWEEKGEAMLDGLNGQFAFALWDRRRGELFLARDQFGICPLYWAVVDGLLLFASEIKAILAHPRAPREVDLTGLDQCFSLPGPISPRTLFRGIHSLPPGHHLRAAGGEVRVREYWDLDYPREGENGGAADRRGLAAELEERFDRSVGLRLQADVPVGFFLSGGLDSSLIAATIHRLSPGVPRHSFSVTFSDERISEARYQHLMAGHVGSIHHETAFAETDVATRLERVVYHAECPLKETYDTASLALSQCTRDAGIRVVLNGEGSDELFAGYVGYRFDKRRAGEPPRQDLDTLLGNEIRQRLWGDPGLHYEKDELAFREVKEMLYAPELVPGLDDFDCTHFPVVDHARLAGRHPVHKRSYLDFKLRLAGHLIADHGDRMTMANSVEGRYPFLDLELVELCRRIPADFKLEGFTEKSILKDVARPRVPAEIVEREKFGFVAPGSPALLQRDLDWVADQLSYERVRRLGYFNPDTVETLKKRYSQPGFRLDQALEDDLLIVVLTFGLLQETFGLPALG
jgi:asparagine synthase (glutamine-hydrolysing)